MTAPLTRAEIIARRKRSKAERPVPPIESVARIMPDRNHRETGGHSATVVVSLPRVRFVEGKSDAYQPK